jgi:mRNA interferase MazF
MKRGELYRVFRAARGDPEDFRVFVVVSRQVLIDSKYSTVTCAPIYTAYDGLST